MENIFPKIKFIYEAELSIPIPYRLKKLMPLKIGFILLKIWLANGQTRRSFVLKTDLLNGNYWYTN
ncbi:hypothetical protein CYV15_05195 [Riemerella anatipestifer]|nr:hypothetical protein RIA_0579 [Riemerella anatipestifer RA-GD]AGC41285.1 hypothetical protein G148_1981 [Riemerella anatipestifer RA-CH-2]AKP69941.1 hypothetical protein CG08_1809 [Riemerella anatipestifer]AKQ40359.1 hypothetical protein AS87_08595 [Riemerella anatipestifer Yb2]AKP71903.1 hypothetical protein CG09_1782 [Riemerella anatipestifer]